ncbi:hypothetical protein KC573_01090 [candidate division WWE3 bacterium]|uniref:DUF1648 domain-containing protein n=1 Tax=candidate division WWE3 bacterium TaxID=2053526 RepID=A0A955LVF8_UNCKA|nr:hypothetical protein [candidate division WWE3 bacterium]
MLKSRHFLTYFSISFFSIATMWWIMYLYAPQLPQTIPFNFLSSQGNGQLVAQSYLWRLPAYATAGTTILTIIAGFLHKRDEFYSQLVLSSNSFLCVIALLSLVRIVFLFT